MGSTSAINSVALNPGVANLLNTLSNAQSPITSSPTLVSALEKAPPSDIVQLSERATQLQNVNALFGGAGSTSPFASGSNNNDFTNLQSILTGSSGPTSQAALAATQLQNVDALFGIQSTATAANTSDPFSNFESLLAGASSSGVSASALSSITNALNASPSSSASSSSSSTTPASQAAQLAQYEALQQIQNTQNLFGSGSIGSTNLLG